MLLLVITTLVLPPTYAAPVTPTAVTAVTADGVDYSEPGGTIHYTYAPSGQLKAWAHTVGGAQPERLTDAPADMVERYVDVSPDGQKVALVTYHKDAPPTQWKVAVYTRGAATPDWQVTLEEPQTVTWSPDGRSLAVTHGPGGYWDRRQMLDVYKADGTGDPVRLAQTYDARYVAWSPDSTRVAATVTDMSLTVPWGISVYQADGSGSSRLGIPTDMPSGTDSRIKLMSWTADGAALIYFRNANSGPQLVRQPPGGQPSILTPNTEMYQRAPVMWGPWLMGHVGFKPTFLNVETGETRTIDVPTFQLSGWASAAGTPPPPAENQPPSIGSVSLVDRFVTLGTEVKLLVSGLSDPDGQVTTVKTTWGPSEEGANYSFVRQGETELRYVKHTYGATGTHTITSTAYDDDDAASGPKTIKVYVSEVGATTEPGAGPGRDVTVDASRSALAVPGTRIEVDHDGQTTSASGLRATVPVQAATGSLAVRVFGTDPEQGVEVELGATTTAYDVTPPPDPQPEPGVQLDGTLFGTGRGDGHLAGSKAYMWDVGSDAAPRRVTSSPDTVSEEYVTVSPDGTRVAVIRRAVTVADGASDVEEVAVYQLGASEPLWSRVVDYVQALNWSPDGRTIAAVRGPAATDQQLLLLSADGTGTPRELVRMRTVRQVAWSPDSETIAFSGETLRTEETFGISDLFLVDVSTGKRRRAPFYGQSPDYPDDAVPLGWDETGSVLTYAGENARTVDGRTVYETDLADLHEDGRTTTGVDLGNRFPTMVDAPMGTWFAGSIYVRGGTGDAGFLDVVTEDFRPFPAAVKTMRVQDWRHSPGPDVDGGGGDRITVTTISDDPVDDGCTRTDCTLREAIDEVNNGGSSEGTPVIDLPDDGGPIQPTTPLPPIQEPVVVIGSGDPEDVLDEGARIDRVGVGADDGCAAAPVVIDGSRAGAGAEGLRVRTGRDARRATVLHGLSITGFDGDGASVSDSRRVRFQCGSSVANGGAGLGVHDSHDVTAVGEVALVGNRGDGLRITGASWRVRSWAGRISGNGGLAVDLGDNGVTANDPGDGDTGPNSLLNHPVVERIADDPDYTDPMRLLALVRIPSGSDGRGRIDLYRNTGCDGSGHGELGWWLAGAVTDLSTVGGRLLAVPFRDGGSGPVTATLVSGAGMSEASACRTAAVAPQPPGTTTDDPIRTHWPVTEGTTSTGGSGGQGGTQPGDPADGSGDNGTYGGDVPPDSGTAGDTGSPGGTDPSGGPTEGAPTPPVFDVGNHVVAGFEGSVSVEPAPGVLDDVVGGLPPYQVEKLAGGNMPDGRWGVQPTTGAVTMDAVGLDPGGYNGRFRVRDARGQVTEVRDIAFVVLDLHDDPPPRVPFVTTPDTYSGTPGETVSVPVARGVLANDQADTTMTATRVAGGTLAASRVTLATDGALTVRTTGLGEGTHSFLYRATTSDGLISPATLVRIVLDNGNRCPTPRDDTYSVISGENFRVDAALGALANDTDREGDAMTARVDGVFQQTDIGMNPDGSIWLDARRSNPGTMRGFDYRVTDSRGESCGTARVTLNIEVNEPPVVNDNVFTVAAGQRFTLPARGLLGNDLDPDGPELGLTSRILDPITGLRVSTDGSLVYNAPRRRGTYVATYRAIDPLGGRTTGSVTFHVVDPALAPPVNRAPVATSDTFYRVHADSMLVVGAGNGVLANDRDPDGDELYAEPMTTDSRTRFPLTREGTFVFRPRMADIGRTLTFRYRAIEKGYSAAMSPIRDVSITVMAPRERCRTVTDSLVTETTAKEGEERLATTEAGFGWCWDERTVTRVGTLRGDGGFDTSRRTAGEVVGHTEGDVESTWTFLVEGQATEVDRASASLLTGALRAQFTTQADYRTCINPSEIAIQLIAHITKLKAVPGAEKVLRLVAKYSLKQAAEAVHSLVKAASRFLLAVNVGGLLVDLAMGMDDDGIAGPLVDLMETIESATITVEVDGQERTLPVLEGLREALKVQGAAVAVKNALTCLPLAAIPGFGDATATHQLNIVPDEEYDSAELTSVDGGFFPLMAKWRRIVDLFDQTAVSISWRTEQEDSDTVYVGCDYTRTRPDQTPYAPPQLPGDPPRTC